MAKLEDIRKKLAQSNTMLSEIHDLTATLDREQMRELRVVWEEVGCKMDEDANLARERADELRERAEKQWARIKALTGVIEEYDRKDARQSLHARNKALALNEERCPNCHSVNAVSASDTLGFRDTESYYCANGNCRHKLGEIFCTTVSTRLVNKR